MIKNVRHFIVRVLIIALTVVLIFSVFMFFNQEKFIYFPDDQDFDNCPGFADSEKVSVSGTRMYYLEDKESETILVYYHGNAGSVCDRAFVKDRLKDAGNSLLFVEYTGYSGDTRKPSKNLILQDVKNAKEFISQSGHEKIVLMGTSLGSAISTYHQTLQEPEKLILLSPFDSLSEVGKIHYPFLPIRLLLREEYDTAEWLRDYTGEIMIIHGTQDEIIPIKLSKRLYNLVPSHNKNYITVKGATHNNLLHQPEVWEAVIDFLNTRI